MAPRLDFSHKERMQLIFTFVTGFLVLCLLLLHIATAAHWNELLQIRVTYIIYPAQAMSRLCVIIFIVQLVDRILLLLGFFWIKIRDIKPRLVSDPLNAEYPMVLVQIPMCNEREVYEQSIASVCHIDWPKDRLLIQVLDDSDEETIKLLIREEVSRWSGRGVNIRYHHRSARKGYKAGNLNSAMTCDYANNYEFVAIFDADFQPSPDFLKQTVPHFKGNPELGLVQARWKFVNKDENLITRMQNINMNFHFEVEQQVNGVFLNFFGFNGTAGVWRIKALEDSGGWLDRTTVEDMDIAVRAHLHGWKFIFLNDVEVLCEVPESYEAYRKQQHRWHSGPVNLFRLCLPDVIPSKISIWKKANLILLFFLLRKLILPLYSFTLLCVVLPLTTLIPETKLPAWLIVYVPIFMSFFNVFPSPKSFPLTIPYLLFENTMSVTKFDAMITGLFQLGGSYEWTVTKKSGRPFEETMKYKDLSHTKLHRRASESVVLELGKLKKQEENEVVTLSEVNKSRKLYKKELAIAILLLIAGARSLLSGWWVHFCFLLFQGISFIFVGLGLVGE